MKSPQQVLAEIEQLPPEQQAEALYYLLAAPLLMPHTGRKLPKRKAN